MKKFAVFVLVIAGLVAVYFYFVSDEVEGDQGEIMSILDRQTACWNDGNIDCFMVGYWKSDSLMFIGDSGITYGYENTLDRYKKTYPDKQSMGELEFDIMEIRRISADVYLVVGKFFLQRNSMDDLSGIFTLTFRRIDGSWVIVADHTA